MTNDSHKARLFTLLAECAVISTPDTCGSGRNSAVVFDMRRATLHHEAAPLIGHVMLDLLEEAGFTPGEEYMAVGGTTRGAESLAIAMLHAATSRGLDLDVFAIVPNTENPEVPPHIDGPEIAGKRVIVLDDTATTGKSLCEAAAAVSHSGAEVVAAAAIMDHHSGAQERLTAAGYPYFSALTVEDLPLS